MAFLRDCRHPHYSGDHNENEVSPASVCIGGRVSSPVYPWMKDFVSDFLKEYSDISGLGEAFKVAHTYRSIAMIISLLFYRQGTTKGQRMINFLTEHLTRTGVAERDEIIDLVDVPIIATWFRYFIH